MTKKEYIERGYAHHFADDMKATAEYCKKHFPGIVSAVIPYADMFCEHKFLFNTENDLDHLGTPIEYGEQIDWEYKPGVDQEYVYQFNRHRCFITLGQAYQLTGDEKYARCYVDMLMDWIKRNPFRFGDGETKHRMGTTWRILEAGFRGEYWTKAFYYFLDSPNVTEEVLKVYEECIHRHCEYIMAMHSPYRLISNWGVIENHGLFMFATSLPKSEKSAHYIEVALGHLEKLCRMAIMPDGVEWEQSPSYHNEVLKDLLDVILIAERNDIPVPKALYETTRRMSMANVIWQKPDHHEFMMGDSDDMDIGQFLCRAACTFLDPVFKFGASRTPDYETVWDYGADGIRAYEELAAEEPKFTSATLSDTGNHYFRSDWSRKANLMHFHCGTIGAGHGHSDQLHFDLVAKGEDVLVDSGRYTYVYNEKRREYKDPMAHNTITVDHELFTICKDSWECSKLSQPVKQQFKLDGKFEFVQAGHLGYMDRGVFVNRKIVYIRPDIYVIMDECYGTGPHSYQSYYHFDSKGKVTLKSASTKEQETCGDVTVAFEGQEAYANLYDLSKTESIALLDTHMSRRYNEEEENKTLRVDWAGDGFASNLLVIETGDKNRKKAFSCEKLPVSSALKHTDYPEHMAEGVKITADGEEYVVIFCHQEVNSPTDLVVCDGCIGFGNVIVFDKKEDTEVGHVMVY